MHIAPDDIQLAGGDLAIRWSDGVETYLALEMLRRSCPCAGCCGEPDALGHVDVPRVTYDPATSFTLRDFHLVGGYAFQPVWADGHSTGLFSYSLLRRLAPVDETIPSA